MSHEAEVTMDGEWNITRRTDGCWGPGKRNVGRPPARCTGGIKRAAGRTGHERHKTVLFETPYQELCPAVDVHLLALW
ncbi:jg21121 [Pararge aegeria aegeria]|uniref:Jg21121 protein n=1 Tax=Pararge aegeria aegeria TaxID=348720 RepID=A0A8S4RM11_9NEOP|nr:jg21121 [Pararge aegeria aegeria]